MTDACDHPKEAASRHKVVRCSSGDALDREWERPGAQWSVDADMLSREGPGLVLASDSAHACPADAHAVAEVYFHSCPMPLHSPAETSPNITVSRFPGEADTSFLRDVSSLVGNAVFGFGFSYDIVVVVGGAGASEGWAMWPALIHAPPLPWPAHSCRCPGVYPGGALPPAPFCSWVVHTVRTRPVHALPQYESAHVMLEQVAAAAAAAAEAVRLVDKLRARLRAAAAEVAAAQSRPRVMILDSLQPLSLGDAPLVACGSLCRSRSSTSELDEGQLSCCSPGKLCKSHEAVVQAGCGYRR